MGLYEEKLMSKSFGAVCAAAAISFAMPALAQTAAPAAQPAPAAPAAPAASGTLIAVAKADPDLSTFAKLAAAAGLDTTLASTGPLTVLAPSNAAFAKLPADQLADLSKPENAAKLQQVLLYHVIPASAPASAIKGTKGEVPSATPNKLSIDGTGDTVKVNGANVVRADVTASNGIIHVVDTVLMPGAATAAAPAEATTAPATN
jgi:uncharacterized surface protein with fasciclin (FAS1) repeats